MINTNLPHHLYWLVHNLHFYFISYILWSIVLYIYKHWKNSSYNKQQNYLSFQSIFYTYVGNAYSCFFTFPNKDGILSFSSLKRCIFSTRGFSSILKKAKYFYTAYFVLEACDYEFLLCFRNKVTPLWLAQKLNGPSSDDRNRLSVNRLSNRMTFSSS